MEGLIIRIVLKDHPVGADEIGIIYFSVNNCDKISAFHITTKFNLHKTIKLKNKLEKSGAERVAKNTPIQGSAADIVKMAMVAVYNQLKEKVPSAGYFAASSVAF